LKTKSKISFLKKYLPPVIVSLGVVAFFMMRHLYPDPKPGWLMVAEGIFWLAMMATLVVWSRYMKNKK